MFSTNVQEEMQMSGKALRLNRIFKDDGKTVIVALDHGQFQGPLPGISNMPETLRKIVAGGPDALILNPGIVAKHYDLLAGKTSVIVRITGASTNYSPSFDYHRLTTSVEHALSIGADAVIVMGFICGPGESKSLELIGHVAEACDKCGLPLIVEMLPQDLEHFTDPTYISTGARAAYELGADVLKVYYTGNDSFRTIVDSVAIPVVIAGGPKDKDAFVMASEAIQLGAKGVAFGRNVFQAEDPMKYVKELSKIVHG
ncbi:MAG: fructose-bisphosphate aldolase, class [Kosmotoga sp.]|jgi:DhnA family fructose-bisphosphate aldolase class Ia|nr:fructose-bisphosphate aldolase, class [Kosmotoga sp.]MDK2953080.1 fructose-bisphosphate aldolase, class [Kosmotoga sp.]